MLICVVTKGVREGGRERRRERGTERERKRGREREREREKAENDPDLQWWIKLLCYNIKKFYCGLGSCKVDGTWLARGGCVHTTLYVDLRAGHVLLARLHLLRRFYCRFPTFCM